jgi:ABC-type sulfate/molybdate transport systems ATPase subunit
MRGGRIEHAASPVDICNRPAKPSAVGLVSASNLVHGSVRQSDLHLGGSAGRNDMTGADARPGAAKLTPVPAIPAAVRRTGDPHRRFAAEAGAQVGGLDSVAARA